MRVKRRSSIWIGSAVLALVMLVAGPAKASPIYSLSLSDGSKTDGADITSISLNGGGGSLVGLFDSLTPFVIVDVALGKVFDSAVLTQYNNGAKVGEYDFSKVLFTSAILGGISIPPTVRYSFTAGSATFVPVGGDDDKPPTGTPEPTTLALIGIGAGSAAWFRRRTAKNA